MKDLSDIEKRIKAARSKREELVTLRAEKAAELNAAKKTMEKIEEKAASNGLNLETLEDLIIQKKQELESSLEEFETSLKTVSELLSQHDN